MVNQGTIFSDSAPNNHLEELNNFLSTALPHHQGDTNKSQMTLPNLH